MSGERLRDILVSLGCRSGELSHDFAGTREPAAAHDEYVNLANPIAPERVVRRSLLASVLENVETNARESISAFEIGPYLNPTRIILQTNRANSPS
jgi:phenylalanyl-tRNA synthetase beta subunit